MATAGLAFLVAAFAGSLVAVVFLLVGHMTGKRALSRVGQAAVLVSALYPGFTG